MLAVVTLVVSDENKDDTKANKEKEQDGEIGKHFTLIVALILGPASICSYLTLLYSFRKSIISELIIPVEALVSLGSYIVIFESGIFSDADLPQVYMSAVSTICLTILFSLLFLTTTWHISFMLRNAVYFATWVYSYIVRLRIVAA